VDLLYWTIIRGGSMKQGELEDISKEASRRKLKHLKEIELHFGLG